MKKNILSLSLIAVLLAVSGLFLTACSSPKVLHAEELLQLPKYAVVYTAGNIWYTDPLNISSENVQVGKILPFGTRVEFESTTETEVRFRADGKLFRIVLDINQMEVMQQYLRRAFTTKTAEELAADAGPSEFEKMRRGIVQPGMTREQVLITYGRPCMSRTSSMQNETWIYQADSVKSRRVIFRNDKVLEILELD